MSLSGFSFVSLLLDWYLDTDADHHHYYLQCRVVADNAETLVLVALLHSLHRSLLLMSMMLHSLKEEEKEKDQENHKEQEEREEQ